MKEKCWTKSAKLGYHRYKPGDELSICELQTIYVLTDYHYHDCLAGDYFVEQLDREYFADVGNVSMRLE